MENAMQSIVSLVEEEPTEGGRGVKGEGRQADCGKELLFRGFAWGHLT